MKLIVTLTTIPSRELAVIETIKSLLNNTIKPDLIYIHLRKKIIRLNTEFSANFKSKLENISSNIIVNECKDYGSLTKLYPIIELETDPDTLIITTDDDIIYSQFFIEGLLCGYNLYNNIKIPENVVIGYSGIAYPDTALNILKRIDYLCFQENGSYTEILESGFGTIIKREWLNKFPIIPEETPNSNNIMYMCDDYFVSLYFDTIGIKKKIVNLPWIGRKGDDWSSICKFIEDVSNNTDSLSNNTRSIDNYYKAMTTIKTFLDIK